MALFVIVVLSYFNNLSLNVNHLLCFQLLKTCYKLLKRCKKLIKPHFSNNILSTYYINYKNHNWMTLNLINKWQENDWFLIVNSDELEDD